MGSRLLGSLGPAILAIALGAGCKSNAVHGKVAGFAVPIRSSFLIYHPPEGDADGLAVVTMSDLPSACASYRFWYDEFRAASTPEEMATAWARSFPEQFWEVVIAVYTEGTTWPISRTEWQGLGWQEDPSPGRIGAVLVQHNAHRPAEWFEGLEGYENHFYTNAGVVRWRNGEPSARLSGVFETATVDEQGVDTGPVKIEFNATPCADTLEPEAVLPVPPDLSGGADTGT